ncbi:MAG: GNAT family N-acetyltransferase, partial [Pseudolabrys sp.]
DEAYRGRGYARALLNAFVAEACSRGVHRIWVASYDFQAPGLYEKAGFKRMAEFEGWPEGHMNVVKKSLFLLAVPRGQRKLCPIKRVAKFHGHNSTIEAQCVFSSLATLIAARCHELTRVAPAAQQSLDYLF